MEVADTHALEVLDNVGVTGIGAGRGPDGRAVVVVLTESAGVTGVPSRLDGFTVIVRVSGKIHALAPPPAQASFTFSCSGLDCTFDGSSSEGRRLSFDWDFGDGNTGTGKVVVQGYEVAGTYDVTLTVTDKDGITDTTDPPVEVTVSIDGGSPPTPPGDADCYSTGETKVKCERPVPIGVSTGHPAITAGTIGARVAKGGNVYALSNNHVYAASNAASIGDNVLQPGDFDGGVDPGDAIGTLEPFTALIFNNTVTCNPAVDTTTCNFIDAAIALSSTSDLGNSTPSDGYGTPKSQTVAAFINQRVKKHGRTTGQTKGSVQGIGFTVDVNYGAAGVARFVNQIVIGPGNFSAGGDSRSLIVDDSKGRQSGNNRKPVGLLFAGGAFFTIANPIDTVLGEYGVTIDGN